jgi:lysine 2,3-aminomutase
MAQPDRERRERAADRLDPLIEARHEVAPGVVYKYRGRLKRDGTVVYYGRALWTISRFCAT